MRIHVYAHTPRTTVCKIILILLLCYCYMITITTVDYFKGCMNENIFQDLKCRIKTKTKDAFLEHEAVRSFFIYFVRVSLVCVRFRPDRVGDFLRSNQIMKCCQCLYAVVNCGVFLYNPTIRPRLESKPSVGESDRLQLEKRTDNTATRIMSLASRNMQVNVLIQIHSS